jgi:type VI secretion system protein ImpC
MPKESLQKKIGRVRPPRVQIIYEAETGGAIEKRELPFVVGVMADLSGQPDKPLLPVKDRRFIEIDRDNFDEVLAKIEPQLAFKVENKLSNDSTQISVGLRFSNMEDFEPQNLVEQLDPLRRLIELRRKLSNLRSSLYGNDKLEEVLQQVLNDNQKLDRLRTEVGLPEPDAGSGKGTNIGEPAKPLAAIAVTTEVSLLEKILKEGRLVPTEEQHEAAKQWIKALVEQVLNREMKVSADTEAMLNRRIANIDQALSNQLNEVMHSEPFQKLEAAWRGLKYFVFQTETSTGLKIKVFNISKGDLLKDLIKASEFDQGAMFNKIDDEGYGVLGGAPFGVLVGDYEFSHHPQDIEILEKMSNIAAAANAPFLAAVSPKMFNFESFTALSGPSDLKKIFDGEVYARWTMFRRSDDSRYVGLCLPRVLMRLPYGTETAPVEEFDYEERVDDHSKYLWGNTAYAFATRLTDAFARYGWCAAIRGVEGGGLVEALPAQTFSTDEGNLVTECPTEIAITDRRESELAKLGFIPLCHYKGTYAAVFMGAQSTQKPQLYLADEANANARLSVQLQYILAASRFAHYLKAMMRDKIGSFTSREQCEQFLNRWLSNYVLLDDLASQELKAKFPLRDSRGVVVENPSIPAAYNAILYLRPHFQLDEMAVSLRVVVRLPKGLIGRPLSTPSISCC